MTVDTVLHRPIEAADARPLAGMHTLETALAALTVVALGARQSLHAGVTSGDVLAGVLLPVWLPVLRRYRCARSVVALGAASAVAGVLLSCYTSYTNRVVGSFRDSSLALLVGLVCGIGVVLWARTLMPAAAIGLWFGAGMAGSAILGGTGTQGNAWKFALAVPVAMLLLSAVQRARDVRLLELLALGVLAAVSVAYDSRSYFATFLLVALLVLWQLRIRHGRRGSTALSVLMLGGVVGATYFLGSTLLVNGYLGRAAQARSIEQIRMSGSLLLGGRPELQAWWALLVARPTGFGMGVIADPRDVLIAKAGLRSINYAPNNGYVDRFMFGNQVELHSVIGDLWAQSGLVGLALTLLIAVVLIRCVVTRTAAGTGDALLLFLCLWALWSLLFSPLYAAAPVLVLAVGLALSPARA